MTDTPRFITAERWAEIVATADIPETLRDALSGKAEPDGLVHWRSADQQDVVWFFGVHRPTRCGRFAHDAMGYPLGYVTCPKCLELASADGLPVLLEQRLTEILVCPREAAGECFAAILDAAGIELAQPNPTLTDEQYREQYREQFQRLREQQSTEIQDAYGIPESLRSITLTLKPEGHSDAAAAAERTGVTLKHDEEGT